MQTADLMQKARVAVRSGHFADARQALRQVIREDPDNYVAWLLLARATPSTAAALEYVNRAQMLQPESPLVQRARVSLEKKIPKKPRSRPKSVALKTALVGASLLFLLLVSSVFWGLPAGISIANARQDNLDLNAIMATLPASWSKPSEFTASFEKPVKLSKQFAKPVVEHNLALEAQPDKSSESSISKALPAAEPEEISPAVAAPIRSAIDDNEPSQESAATDPEITAAGEAELEPLTTADDPQELDTTELETVLAPEDALEPPDESTAAINDNQETAGAETAVEVQEFPASEAQSLRPAGVGPGDRWIDVNLTNQTLVAYEGDTPVFNTLISSGTGEYPTVTGQFQTWIKYESQDMNGYLLGYDYYLPGVPYVMYFYKNFAIHGTYWHNNFGTPMSHGCVNMDPAEAGWLFNWAPLGTTVNVHY